MFHFFSLIFLGYAISCNDLYVMIRIIIYQMVSFGFNIQSDTIMIFPTLRQIHIAENKLSSSDLYEMKYSFFLINIIYPLKAILVNNLSLFYFNEISIKDLKMKFHW